MEPTLSSDKSQHSGIDFLMKYGWLIMLINISIGAIYYFGALGTGANFTQESCNLPEGFSCIDFKIAPEGITLSIQNNLGINLKNVVVEIKNIQGISCEKSNPRNMPIGKTESFFTSCNPDINPNSKINGKIIINYNK